MIRIRNNWPGYLLAIGGMALVTVLFKFAIPGLSLATIALTFLIVVLAVASTYGLGPAIVGSIAGTLCFNFFFIPPVGTLTIQEPQNWVALFAFLITAVIASQLSAAARDRAEEAERRRAEVWKLYQLSRAIIATADSDTAISSIARQVVETFDLYHCSVFIPGEDRWERIAAGGQYSLAVDESEIKAAFSSSQVLQSATSAGLIVAPLKLGVRPIGVVVLSSRDLEPTTVEAIGGLVALALERARFLKEVSHTQALRQSDELKSALLASVSHDLRTPLTSIRAAVDSLLQEEINWDAASLREFHSIIAEEVARLTRLIQNLLEMARIEGGELKPVRQRGPVSEIIGNVLLRCEWALRDHPVRVDVDENQMLVNVDSRLIAEALANLVENAARYSPPGSEINIEAGVEGDELTISVTDKGVGIHPDEINRVFDKFYRGATLKGKQTDGTGMGLAIAKGIIEAHGGRIGVTSSYGSGATFSFSVPAD